MQRKFLARIPKVNLKAFRPPARVPAKPAAVPDQDTAVHAQDAVLPKSPLKLPDIAPSTAYILIPALVLFALILGFVGGSAGNLLVVGIAIGVGLVLVATSGLVAVILGKSIVNGVAPLFMTRYGISERERAQTLVSSMLNDGNLPSFRIVEGELRDDLRSEYSRQFGGMNSEYRRELFKTMGQGPARLYIDSETAVLVEQGGKFQVLHAGPHDLTYADRVKGIAHLRPQRELVDLKGIPTRDMVALDIRVSISYQIKQDLRHLEQTQTHHVELDILRRALLPRDEWRTRTKSQIPLQINALFRECELWQLFLSPPKPPEFSEIATLYSMGQSIVPGNTKFELEDRLKARLNDVCWKWGVEVTRVNVEQVLPPRELSEEAHRTYLAWNHVNEQVLEAERQAKTRLHLAEIEREEARLHKETNLLAAETEKLKEIMQAEGEAAAYEMRMKARADGALEFARRIETLRQAMGNTLDEGTFRELLRALDLLRENEREDLDREELARMLIQARMGRMHE